LGLFTTKDKKNEECNMKKPGFGFMHLPVKGRNDSAGIQLIFNFRRKNYQCYNKEKEIIHEFY